MSNIAATTAKFTPDMVSARIREIVEEALAKHGIPTDIHTVIKSENLLEENTTGNDQAEETIDENLFVQEYRAYKASSAVGKNKPASKEGEKEGEIIENGNIGMIYSGQWECTKCQISFNRLSKLRAHENRVHSELPSWEDDDYDATKTCNDMAPLIVERTPDDDNAVSDEVKIENDGSSFARGGDEASYLIVLLERITELEVEKFAMKRPKFGESSGKSTRRVRTETQVPSSTRINEAGRWPCHLCSKDFTQKGNLGLHLRIHTGEKPFKCPICGNSYRQRSHVQSHMRFHTGERPYKCSFCQKTFTHGSALKAHERIHTGERPYKCDSCPKGFYEASKLKLHKNRIHSDELKFSCELCQENFKVIDGLRAHNKRVHLREYGHQCKVCGKKYFTPQTLAAHIRLHTGEKPFSCTQCSRTFRLQKTLKCHMMVHTGEKPHVCDFCGKRFTQLQHLTLHRRTHTSEKPYSSSFCSCKFRSTSLVWSHERWHKKVKDKDFPCTFCGQHFSCALGRRQHETSHNLEFVICQICRKGFISGGREQRLHMCSGSKSEPEPEIGEAANEGPRQQQSVVMETAVGEDAALVKLEVVG